METSIGLVTGLAIGMAIAFPAAFLTLVFATRNYIVASLAMISIGGIIVTLLGIAKLVLDWPLGIVESVAAVIVVGFSVDYTIHLGHMYNHGAHEGLNTREERFKYAIKKMGGTVMGGAITTAGSGVFMFPATMLFFNKMAYMITLTIVLSSGGVSSSSCLFCCCAVPRATRETSPDTARRSRQTRQCPRSDQSPFGPRIPAHNCRKAVETREMSF